MKRFLEIKNITTRNLVRGLSSKDKSSLQNQDLNRIRLSCPENEILGVTDLILNTPLIANKEFLSGFPKSTNDILFSRRFEPIGIRKEFLFQVARLNHDSKKLCKLICDIADLNESLFKSNYEASFTIIKRIIEKFGYSHIIFRKLALIHVLTKNNDSIRITKSIRSYRYGFASSFHKRGASNRRQR